MQEIAAVAKYISMQGAEPILRAQQSYSSEQIYLRIQEAAEKSFVEPTYANALSNAQQMEEKQAQREALQVQNQTGTFLTCRISGLPIARIISLPWQACPLDIPFASFSEKQINKMFHWILKQRKTNKEGATRESQIFLFYTLLHKCPVEFKHRAYLPIQDARWNEIFKRGLSRLYSFSLWFQGQGIRVRSRFPIWRISQGSEIHTAQGDMKTGNEDFNNFFSVLSTWERTKEELETRQLRMHNAEGYAEFEETKATRSDYESAMYEWDKITHTRRARKNEILPLFDRRSKGFKNYIGAILEELHSFYSIPEALRINFDRFVMNPQILSSDELAKKISHFSEKGAGIESFSKYHKDFIEWLKHNLALRKAMQKKLEELEEKEIAENNFVMQVVEKIGAPRRQDFQNGIQYMRALQAWKLQGEQGEKS